MVTIHGNMVELARVAKAPPEAFAGWLRAWRISPSSGLLGSCAIRDIPKAWFDPEPAAPGLSRILCAKAFLMQPQSGLLATSDIIRMPSPGGTWKYIGKL